MSDIPQDPKVQERPLSPHLQIYKPQLTSVTSIFHRMTGAALAISLFIVTWALVALATGPASFVVFSDFMGSILGRLILFGWSAAFFYHMCSGLRHMVMDTAAMMDIKSAYKTIYVVYAMTIILTVGVWTMYYYCRGMH